MSLGCATVAVVCPRRFQSRRCSAIRSTTHAIMRACIRPTNPLGSSSSAAFWLRRSSAARIVVTNRCRSRPMNPSGASSTSSVSSGCSPYNSYRSRPIGMTNTSIRNDDSTLIWEPVAKSEDAPPSADQVEQEHDRGNDQQDVNHAAGDIKQESKYPEQEQQNDQRPQHVCSSGERRGKPCAVRRRRTCRSAKASAGQGRFASTTAKGSLASSKR